MQNSFSENENSIAILLEEIRTEKKISPLKNMEEFKNVLLTGIYDIETCIGYYIDFDKDLKARSLLINYVLYSIHNLLAKFKEDYLNEYTELQIKYNSDTII